MPLRDLAGPLVFAALLAALPASAQQARVTPVPPAALGGAAAAVGSELARGLVVPAPAQQLLLPAPLLQTQPTLAPVPTPAVAVRPAAAASIEGSVVQAAGLAVQDAAPAVVAAKTASPLPAADGAAALSSARDADGTAKTERLDEEAARGLELMPVEDFLSAFFDGAAPAAGDFEVHPGIEIPSFEEPGIGGRDRFELTELDGHGGVADLSPGSIFSWRPIEESPGHGLAPLDWFLRKLLAHKGGRFAKGYEFRGAANRTVAQVFFYGERHTDKALIAENMRLLAGDLRPEKGAIILDEGYFGPTLRGTEALLYLAKRGFDPTLLGPAAKISVKLEVRGWDRQETYDLSHHPVLQHHMNLYDVNQHLFSERRGFGYYLDLARKLYATWRNWEVMRELAIDRRNGELDASVREAVEEAGRTGRSVHVIAGAEHLVEHPLLAAVPLIGRPSMRQALVDAVGRAAWWTSKPADSPGLSD
ncbi:MAG: hypothetical protein WC969_08180 [Elusimicrobiota bacterium]|jgi:hypothetical protein